MRAPGRPLAAGLALLLLAAPAAGAAEVDDATQPSATVAPSVPAGPVEGTSVPLTPAPGRSVASAADDGAGVVTATTTLEDGVHVVGVRWEGEVPEEAELRVRAVDGGWGRWQPLNGTVTTEGSAADVPGPRAAAAAADQGVRPAGGDTGATATEGDVVVGPAEIQVRVSAEVQAPVLESWSAETTPEDVAAVAALPPSGSGLVVGTRADWGADESVRGTTPAELLHESPKVGVTVHHTATSNDYAPEEVPAILRGIFAYHAQTLGWGDIGYAALVDRYGRVWEGRAGGLEENVQLAHALGMNRDWSGISVLGDHDESPVPGEPVGALAQMVAWTLDTHGAHVDDQVDHDNPALGWSRAMPALHGHRDANATACPGEHLYEMLDVLRPLVGALQTAGSQAVQRIGGEDRYSSAALLAGRAFLEGSGTAYLTSGADVVDALAVGGRAASEEAAVLLTRPDKLPDATVEALADLGVQEVRIVGGEAAVSTAVEEALTAAGLTVTRVAGDDRYAVAAQLSGTVTEAPGWSGTVYLANGSTPADALGGSAAAAEQQAAMLLTQAGHLPAVTREVLGAAEPQRVVVLGGPEAVQESVVDELRAALPAAVVERVGGQDRYATSALLAAHAFDEAASAVAAAGFASTDAMTGTQLAARHGSPVVLVRPGCRPRSVDVAYDQLGVTLTRLAGGPGVLDWSAGSQTCG